MLAFVIILIGAIAAWIFLGSATGFETQQKALYIRSNAATEEAVIDSLRKNKIVTNTNAFKWLAGQFNYWKKIKPGKYEIKKGSSLLSIVRMLHNGSQTPVNLVISKIRTKEDLAHLVGNHFECDSMQMIRLLDSQDSLEKFNIDTASSMWVVLPNTYTFHWNVTPSIIYERLYASSKKFWTDERVKEAQDHKLTPVQAYILASIIEEETNVNNEKGNIASVYLNRLNKGMPLQADPTVKFAMRDFGLKRIYGKYTQTESPYNTYKNKGLPPGPICTPSKKTIDAVLNAPATDFLYFVVDTEHPGTHTFSRTYEEHLEKAKEYHNHLDSVKRTEVK